MGDTEPELCICAYNWRITHYQSHQLRLVLRCLPEYTTELAQRLRNRNITCRLRTPGTIHVTNAESLVKLAHQLGVGPVLSMALQTYAGTWAGTRARKKRLPGAREKQTEAARKVMALIPRPREA